VTTEICADPVAAAAPGRADGGGDVPDPRAGSRGGDACLQRGASGGDQAGVGRGWRPDGEGDRGIGGPPAQHGPAVDAEQVTLGQPVTAGDAELV
jgi:hypothetical protein